MLNKLEIDSPPEELELELQEGNPAPAPAAASAASAAPAAASRPKRDLPAMMRKIPVTLTLEVGSARMSLQDLVGIDEESVVELDTLAGEPLVLKVNGTPIGRAQVVVVGDSYGLKVVELSDLDFGSFGR